MGLTSELFITKKYVSKEEWNELIRVISTYNGYLKKWKIFIKKDKNQIRYFIKTKCSLPSTLNNLDSFLLKNTEDIIVPTPNLGLPFISKIGSSTIDIINYTEIKNKGNLELIEITIKKLSEEKFISTTSYYINKNNFIIKYKDLLAIPSNILSIDFEGNKRYFYKSPPKYLDINKILHLLSTDYKKSILKIDTYPYLQGDFYLNQNSYNFDKHSLVLGSSGTGKSKFISLLINNIYKNNELKNKYKVVVIDPHASLESDIGEISKVLDFQDELNSIDLFMNNSKDTISSTELLLDLLKSLLKDQYNSKLERVLRHSIYILIANESFNFTNLRNLLLDLEYRNNLIKELNNTLPVSVIDFFLTDFNDLKTKSYGEAISPIIAFIDEMEMIPIFNNQITETNLSNTIKANFLTLFSLDRTKLGDKVTKTISGLVMQQLLSIIQKRDINEHIIFIVDEVAVIENPILSRFLSEARKYNLSLILAGQYFNQISEDLKNSIFANVINYYIFRISKLDATTLVDNFNITIPLDNTKERKIKLLTELNNRECIVRIDSNGILLPAFKSTTLNYNSIPRIKTTSVINKDIKEQPKIAESIFKIENNINLKDILKKTSSSRKVVE